MPARNIHNLRTYEREGDLIRSSCVGCPWVSEWFDTKREAGTAHSDHDLEQRLKKVTG